MNRIALVAFVSLALGAFASAPVLSEEKPAPVRLAFLDVRRAFEEFGGSKTAQDRLRARTDELEERFKKENARIEQMAEGLNTLADGGEERLALERQVDLSRMTLKRDREAEVRKLQREARREEAAVYRRICDAAGELAAERGLAAVLPWVPLPDDFEKRQDADLLVTTRGVLWREPGLDVTADVIARLNK